MATFKEAFAEARRKGKKEFSWKGKSYNTRKKGESNSDWSSNISSEAESYQDAKGDKAKHDATTAEATKMRKADLQDKLQSKANSRGTPRRKPSKPSRFDTSTAEATKMRKADLQDKLNTKAAERRMDDKASSDPALGGKSKSPVPRAKPGSKTMPRPGTVSYAPYDNVRPRSVGKGGK